MNKFLLGCLGTPLLVVLCAFVVAGMVFGTVKGTAVQPTPLPTLVVADDDAALLRELGIIFQPFVDVGANALRTDTQAAHPAPRKSWLERSLPYLLAALAIAAAAVVVCTVGVTGLAFWDRQARAREAIRKAELRIEYTLAQNAIDSI